MVRLIMLHMCVEFGALSYDWVILSGCNDIRERER